MKKYGITIKNGHVLSVQAVPEYKTEEQVKQMIEDFNKVEYNIKEGIVSKLIEVDNEMAAILDHLIYDRKTDKERLLDAVRDLRGLVSDLSYQVESTDDYIRQQLSKEDDSN